MDKLEDWELIELFQSLQYADTNAWEQTRSLMWIIAQSNSKRKLNLKSIMKFPWDEEYKEKHNIEITNDEVSRLKSMAQNYLKNINTDNNGS